MSETTHQATLAAGGVIFMDDAFFSGFIQGADGYQRSCACVFRGAALDGGAGILDEMCVHVPVNKRLRRRRLWFCLMRLIADLVLANLVLQKVLH